MKRKNKRKLVQAISIAVSFGTFLLVIAAVTLLGYRSIEENTEEIVQGEMDVSEYRVSSKIAGRIKEIRVAEGDSVWKGQVLAVIDAPEIQAKKLQAESVQQQAAAVEEMTDNGAREEQIRGALATVNQAKASLDIARTTYNRLNNLYEEGVITQQKRDEAMASMRAAEARVNAAQSQYDMAVNGARKEEKKASSAKVSQAKGAVEEMKSYIKETVQLASDDGVVTCVYPEVGELVGTGSPILSVAVMRDMWGTFNFREDLLHGIDIGDTIIAYSPALDRNVKMKVYYMKDIGSFSAWKATQASGEYDLKTFEVRARPIDSTAGFRPGMSLVVRLPKSNGNDKDVEK